VSNIVGYATEQDHRHSPHVCPWQRSDVPQFTLMNVDGRVVLQVTGAFGKRFFVTANTARGF
jgi:hypothetical protein